MHMCWGWSIKSLSKLESQIPRHWYSKSDKFWIFVGIFKSQFNSKEIKKYKETYLI